MSPTFRPRRNWIRCSGGTVALHLAIPRWISTAQRRASTTLTNSARKPSPVVLDHIKPVAFDSWDVAIAPRHVLASARLPQSVAGPALDGRRFWDGGLWSNPPLREALNCLQKRGSPGPKAMTDCLVFVIDLFAPAQDYTAVITGSWDVWA